MNTIEVDSVEGEILDPRFFRDETITQIIRNVIGRDRVVVLTCVTEPRMVPFFDMYTFKQQFRVCKLWKCQFSYAGDPLVETGEFEVPVSDTVFTMKDVVQYAKNRSGQ